MEDKVETAKFEELARGEVADLYEKEIQEVIENVLDKDYPRESVRKLTIEISIKPEDGNTLTYCITFNKKLPKKALAGLAYYGKKNGKQYLSLHDPNQMELIK